jgi:hypothetical protein
MRTGLCPLFVLAICAWDVAAQVAPARIDRARFSEILSGAQAVVIEALDYEGHAGDNPYRLANGTLRSTATGRSGTLPTIGSAPCSGEDGPFRSNALDVNDPGSTSVFSEFPEGTTLWSTRVCFMNPEDVLEVSVVGGSGTLTFTAAADTLESFLGFEDAAGLSSVTIRNVGADGRRPSSYFYDEITTARAGR